MKKFENGRSLWLWLALSTLAIQVPAVERRTWMNQQITNTVFRPAKETSLFSFVSASQYVDSINVLASLAWDPGPLELRGFGGARSFLDWTAEGRIESAELANERFFYGAELGRSFYSKETGAIRIGWLQYPQSRTGFVTLGLETSKRIHSEHPWFYRLLFSYWLNVLGTRTLAQGDSLNTNVEITRTLEKNALGLNELGLQFSWIYRTTDVLRLGAGRYDLMMFGISPTAKWQGSSGTWALSLNLRMFLDTQFTLTKAMTHPSALAVPGVSVSWGQPQ